MGGSTRLLLNLARYLGDFHDVSLCLAATANREATAALVRHFGDITLVPHSEAALNDARYDLALMHLPFSLQPLDLIKIPRKMAVLMELVARHPIPILDEHAGRFERILYLHPEQVQHFSAGVRADRCDLLPVINNIDFEPAYVRTHFLGAVGGAHKTGLESALRFLRALQQAYGLRIWSGRPLTLEGLPAPAVREAIAALGAGRLAALPVEADMRVLMRSYDALLHLPRHGNGTSVVVSDALYCGKPVILTPLPDYRQAYGDMEGVLFADAPLAQLIERVQNWSAADFRRISQAYRAGYDRDDALRQWRRAVED